MFNRLKYKYMKYKFKNGGIVKLQNAWTTIHTFEDAFNRAFARKTAIKEAEQKAKEQVASEKPKYTFVNPYDITRGWREATEDAAKQDKYTVQNLGGSEEEAQKAYDDTWKNSRKQLAATTGMGLGTTGLLGASFGAFGPLAADVINSGFTGASIYNLASNNGIRKTIRLMNERKYPRAFRSLAGDLLDLSAVVHTGGLINRLNNSIKRGASIGNAYRSDVAARMLQSAKLQGGWHPVGEDLYINSIDKTPSTYYTNDPVPVDSIHQYGWIGGGPDTSEMIHTGNEGIDFLTNRSRDGWSTQLRTYNGIETEVVIHPYHVRQYNNRWFLFGLEQADNVNRIANRPLDRIIKFSIANVAFIPNTTIDFTNHFDDVVGVTIPDDSVAKETVVLKFDAERFPYAVSKPIHHSQKMHTSDWGTSKQRTWVCHFLVLPSCGSPCSSIVEGRF